MSDSLHSIRSFLRSATKETPHERLFGHKQRSILGIPLLAWLSSPVPVFLKRLVRSSKVDPLVNKVDLAQAIPTYIVVRFFLVKERLPSR